MRIGLVGCVKQKGDTALPAGELYVSALFRGRRRYVERSCERWFILSARHGLVDPATVLEPYDQTLDDASGRERGRWSRWVLDQLTDRVLLDAHVFEIHAGSAYRDFGLVHELRSAGAAVEIPGEGLPMGKLLAFYAQASGPAGRRSAGPARTSPGGAAPDRHPLRTFLERSASPATLTFSDIERIIGRPLPPSARTHRAWWANSESQVLGRQWLAAGWRAEMVDMTDERIRLTR